MGFLRSRSLGILGHFLSIMPFPAVVFLHKRIRFREDGSSGYAVTGVRGCNPLQAHLPPFCREGKQPANVDVS